MPQGSSHYSSSSSSLIPFGGSWWASLLKSGNNRHHAVDRVLGAAATISLSIIILRLVAQAMKSVQRQSNDNDEESSNNTFRMIQEILKGLFQRKQEEEEHDESESLETVLHTGSCHCRAVTFELAAPRTSVAQHGPGKISYAHTRTPTQNFRFVSGTSSLKIYYVSVPAVVGVEPTVGAHTFCSQCGVHILHASSPNADTIHVNVSCVDHPHGNKPRIKWNQRTASLSSGVPVAKQWEEAEDVEERRNTTWSNMESEDDGTLESSTAKLDENPETPDMAPSDHSWKSANAVDPSPGTPSTVGTVGTDSIVSAMRYRSLALEQQDASSEEDSESLPPTFTKRLLPPLNTSSRSVGGAPDASPSRKTPTTPMMRDQLKYYMSKHLPSSSPKTTRADTTTLQAD